MPRTPKRPSPAVALERKRLVSAFEEAYMARRTLERRLFLLHESTDADQHLPLVVLRAEIKTERDAIGALTDRLEKLEGELTEADRNDLGEEEKADREGQDDFETVVSDLSEASEPIRAFFRRFKDAVGPVAIKDGALLDLVLEAERLEDAILALLPEPE